MKKVFIYAMGGIILPFLASCGDDKNETKYEGVNKIYLSAQDPVIEEMEDTPLTVSVDLTSACEQDMSFNFKILNDEDGILKLENNPVVIPAGSKSATFQVVSNQKELLVEDTYFDIGISELPSWNMELSAVLKVRVKPNPQIPQLTEAQKALIEGYKTKYGIDLNEWLGVVSCHTTVHSPADGYSEAFAAAFTKEYDRKTIITLSELATAEIPVLKMVDDPMGLTEYLAWVLRKETVENTEFWYGEYASPSYAMIMNLLNWNRENPGTLTMSLDNLRLKELSDGTADVEFIGIKTNVYGESVPVVPFEFVFTPWELQKQKIKEGNPNAIDLEAQDGTANPDYYLLRTSAIKDEFGDEANFIEPKGNFNFNAGGKMVFQFVMDHSLAGGYTRVQVEYAKK